MQFRYLKYDLYRYFYPDNGTCRTSLLRKIQIVLTTQGIWAIAQYRFMRWVIFECKVPVLKQALFAAGSITEMLVQITTGILIQPDIDIGPGFYIGHFGGIVMGGDTRIGRFCNVSHGNTFGYAGRGEKRGLPELGDFVYVAPGAKIIGKVRIGNHVAIGANAVVTRDVPDNAVVGGVPARIISFNSSRDFVEFNVEKCRAVLQDGDLDPFVPQEAAAEQQV